MLEWLSATMADDDTQVTDDASVQRLDGRLNEIGKFVQRAVRQPTEVTKKRKGSDGRGTMVAVLHFDGNGAPVPKRPRKQTFRPTLADKLPLRCGDELRVKVPFARHHLRVRHHRFRQAFRRRTESESTRHEPMERQSDAI